ncbi:CBS domain-containing protein [Hyphomicrobium sp.]|uniref:CBS domain-containing protein n=1 Tax=Hyphomicrobium sp. TaxID=82 RepID=UPI000FA9B743|nr:CBS domain-containing protein [Hyphomicrobium sp.]RUO99009.1 MAG: CBS domain-containing protein [Hyphomicrobium sp.]
MIIGQILKSKPRGVMTASPDDTLHEITLRLASKKIGAIIILEGANVAGIISERDIIRLIAEHGAKALDMPASLGMTRNVISCTRDCTLEEIMDTMTKGRFRHMPVMENGALVGIISIGDVVKYHTAEVELEVTAMRDYLATG